MLLYLLSLGKLWKNVKNVTTHLNSRANKTALQTYKTLILQYLNRGNQCAPFNQEVTQKHTRTCYCNKVKVFRVVIIFHFIPWSIYPFSAFAAVLFHFQQSVMKRDGHHDQLDITIILWYSKVASELRKLYFASLVQQICKIQLRPWICKSCCGLAGSWDLLPAHVNIWTNTWRRNIQLLLEC